MAKGGTRFTNAMIAKALRKHDGLIPRAADELKTSRQAVQQRVDRSEELQAVMAEIKSDMKDLARGAIYEGLRNKDGAMARWFAERQMRDEGYGTKIETAFDAAAIESIAEAIAAGGLAAIRAVQAAIADTPRR